MLNGSPSISDNEIQPVYLIRDMGQWCSSGCDTAAIPTKFDLTRHKSHRQCHNPNLENGKKKVNTSDQKLRPSYSLVYSALYSGHFRQDKVSFHLLHFMERSLVSLLLKALYSGSNPHVERVHASFVRLPLNEGLSHANVSLSCRR